MLLEVPLLLYIGKKITLTASIVGFFSYIFYVLFTRVLVVVVVVVVVVLVCVTVLYMWFFSILLRDMILV